MKSPGIRAVEMTRKIRDRHRRRLAGKTVEDVIAFYRAAGHAAMDDARRRRNSRKAEL
jgi:hypothetical protein